ncbi:transcriptional repressor LexA [Sediminicurvatus halobius]|uniref:LexA repressor n=1 Tax=Sediminicurvatus halobius TaxID=2182432 RepID=A0A2U2N027_9GAMM|nr:transcriptional repressor LexA [Spiribacter halobius]PWG62418.1 transcriptional repressor LexA [Spiribacter halobius]UEX79520.1 transcriptional repressor LexA [Spiribacter halobius]
MPPLTPRQREVLEALRDCAREGQAPSLDELCRRLGMRSRGSLHRHVQALVDAGLVQPMAGQHRGVHLTETAMEDADTLPLLGRIAAGRPIEAVADSEQVAVPSWLRGRGRCYVLEVRGDSMADEGILDGDRIVVEHREQARNGEIVVALVDGESATLKRIEQRPDCVILYPANAAHEPQRYHPTRITVQGVVVGQMRRY